MHTKKNTTANQYTLIDLCPEGKFKRVLLKLPSVETEADQYYYWIGRNTPFSELMTDYTQRIAVSLNSVVFFSNRSSIDPSFSANYLKLKNGDSIVVYQRREYMVGAESTLIILDQEMEETRVFIEVKGVGKYPSFVYAIGSNTEMRHLMLDYCDRAAVFFESAMFSFRGSIICPNEFADDFMMYGETPINDVITC